jgi:hypothetical protein
MAFSFQFLGDPARAAASVGLLENQSIPELYRILRCRFAKVAGEPTKVFLKPAPADTHHPTQHGDGIEWWSGMFGQEKGIYKWETAPGLG